MFFFNHSRPTWYKVHILHETDNAILVLHVKKYWLPKSRILSIRLHRNSFYLLLPPGSLP
jgi:hypothetical protein